MTKSITKPTNVLSAEHEALIVLEKEFLSLRLAKYTGQIKDTSRFKKVRAEIVRLKQTIAAKR